MKKGNSHRLDVHNQLTELHFSKTETYSVGIDAVRFIAFLLVFFHHFIYRGGNSLLMDSHYYWGNPMLSRFSSFGSEGVTIFFCLSSYLLCKLLIRELNNAGRISIVKFYLRRILRIWPLYFLYLALAMLAGGYMSSQAITSKELPSLLSFTYNWYQLTTGHSRGLAAILWSLSVEEQIYLILPWLLIIFARFSLNLLASSLIIFGLLIRVLLTTQHFPLYRNSFSYLGVIGIGMFFSANEEKIRNWFQKRIIIYSIIFILFSAAYIISFQAFVSSKVFSLFTFDATAIISIFLLLLLGNDARLLKPFAFLGRRSYGMYLYHWPILTFFISREIGYSATGGLSLFAVLLAFSLVVVIAVISYRYLEKPFLEMRRKFQYREHC